MFTHTIPNELGPKLKFLRLLRGKSAREVAETIGVSTILVLKWESEASKPKVDKLVALAEVYDVSLNDLMNGSIIIKMEC